MRQFIFLLFLYSPISFAIAENNLSEVLDSIRNHHPDILNTLREIDRQEGNIQSATGVYDLKLNTKYQNRADGYYTGDFYDIQLNQFLGILNSELFLGHRRSVGGSLPVYEQQHLTSEDGEYYFGLKFSLLKNLLIDSRRLNLKNSKLEKQKAKLEAQLLLNKISYIGEGLYWDWVNLANQKDLYQKLVEIGEKRQKALKKRTSKGDLARIYLDENMQYIIKRQTSLLEVTQKLQQASQELSLFLRNKDGARLIQKEEKAPKLNFKHDHDILFNEDIPKLQLSELPTIQALELQMNQNQNELKLAENEFLPKLDLKISRAKDEGSSPKSLTETESKIEVNFSMPLQFRKSRGKIQATKSKRQILQGKMTYSKDKIQVKYEQIRQKIETLKQKIKLYEQEIVLANKLLNAEEQKFRSGNSDFFVINIREQKLITSKSKYIEAVRDFHTVMAQAKYITNSY